MIPAQAPKPPSASNPRLAYWQDRRRRGHLLFAAACTSGEEARELLALSPDLLVFHPGFTGRSREGETGMLTALGLMANANDEAYRGAAPLPALCAPCPVAMGVCGTDPFLLRKTAFSHWRKAGLEGLANFPTVGLADGLFRADLEADGFGFGQEVECLRLAREEGLFTVGLACRPEDAAALAAAGCDLLILHLGLTATTEPRSLAVDRVLLPAYLSAARSVRKADPLFLLHADCLPETRDEEAWHALVEAGSGCDGIFAAGGPSRAKALHSLVWKPKNT